MKTKTICLLGLFVFGAVSRLGFCDNEPDWNTYCLDFVNSDLTECSTHLWGDNGVEVDCTVGIELKELVSGRIQAGSLTVSRNAGFSAGVFDLLGVGLLIDGPTAAVVSASAHDAMDSEISSAKRHSCENP